MAQIVSYCLFVGAYIHIMVCTVRQRMIQTLAL